MTREEVSLICKAMSDPNRLKIIEMLTGGGELRLQIAGRTSGDPAYPLPPHEGPGRLWSGAFPQGRKMELL